MGRETCVPLLFFYSHRTFFEVQSIKYIDSPDVLGILLQFVHDLTQINPTKSPSCVQ